ncbi:MAG: 1-deoxy-D-xylulose-5-phosphate synthase, partial [candidate division WOR-3 bacterium]|nr:1-deoxy-D-xylulose-5-phosphate synthase [candidate division WOR-3 bacterium]
AGIVGEDGPTHHGNFDISYLRLIPNMIIAAPKDDDELTNMLKLSIHSNAPFAIRYPRGRLIKINYPRQTHAPKIGCGEILLEHYNLNNKRGKLIVLAVGSMVANSYQAVQDIISNKICTNRSIVLINMRFIKPLDENLLLTLIDNEDIVVTIEENAIKGGFGSSVIEFLTSKKIIPKKYIMIGLVDKFIEQGNREILLDRYGLSRLKLQQTICSILNHE